MAARHTILVVEDDADMAAQLGEVLDSIGYDHTHVATKLDALRIAEQGGFCCVLLDLGIKANPDSIKPHIEAGLTTLEGIRALYPRRNEQDKHCLQIIIVSGHAKEIDYVVKTLQADANDFIAKPVTESRRSLKEVIHEALRKSGRESHERCALVMREARASSIPAAPGVAATGARLRLAVTGQPQRKKTIVHLGGQPVPLNTGPFVMLLRLVAGRLSTSEGWVHRDQLGAKTEQGWKGVSRLKQELRPHLPKQAEVVENDGMGSYRLQTGIGIEEIDLPSLEAHWHGEVRKLAIEIRRLQATPTPAKGPAVRRP
jgi:CheY-like chemotaxis protein